MRKTFRGLALSLLKANRLLIAFTVVGILCSTVLVVTMLAYSLNVLHALEPAEHNEFVLSNLRTLRAYMIVMSFLVLVVTALLVLVNLDILLYRLRHQIALLRSLGAATRQIVRIILIQSFAINLTGTVLGGIVAMFAMKDLFRLAERVFHLPAADPDPGSPVVPFIAAGCCLFFQLFTLIPAYRGTRILPLQLAEANERLDFGGGKNRGRRGLTAAATGITMYLFGYVNDHYVLLFPGLLILLIGCLLLIPVAIERAIRGTWRIAGRRLGRLVRLTLKQMMPQARRNAFAIVSISLTVAIAVFGTTLLSTLNANHLRFLKERYEMPILVHNRLGSQSAIDPHSLRDTLLGFESIRDVRMEGALMHNYLMLHDAKVKITPVAMYSPLVEGLKDDELVISGELAARCHLQAGDEIVIGAFDAELQEILPVGVYRIAKVSGDLEPSDRVLMTWSNPLNLLPAVSNLYIDPADEPQALADLESLRGKYPELQITTLREQLAQAGEGFMQRWGIMVVALAVIVCCAMAGVLNGLMNQMLSKRKEFAVLRTVGVSPAGIVGNILVQVCLYVGLGIVLGGMLGVLMLVLVIALDPAPIAFHFPAIGRIGIGMLLLTAATFAIAGRYLATRSILREMAMDGK